MLKTRQVEYRDIDEIAYHYKNAFGRTISIDQYLKSKAKESKIVA